MKKLLVVMLVLMMVVCLFTTSFAAKKYTVAGIVFQEDQFMKTILAGMKSAAAKEGITLLTANTANQLQKEIDTVNTYTARGVDAICITTLDANGSVPALKAAYDKGIKIVCFNNAINADFPVSTLQSSNTDLGANSGKAAAAYIKAALKGKATIKVATLNFKPQLPQQSDQRENGFLDQIKDLPGVKIVAQQSAWTVDMSVPKAGDIITANPDLDIAYGCNDGGTKGWVLAAKNAGKKIAVFGIDVDQEAADMLLSNDNILQAVCGQNPYQQGYQSIEFAVSALKGKKVQKSVVVPGALFSRTSKTLKADLDKFLNAAK
ncbi:MAG TPA: sugar ABC transporter substrate-binding protein [Firmicutes bacterium]|jgi:sugar transport system substrate-binding protein|nr:sugar ABC transporter substrate-binding protein [Bacillota bacterium]